MGDEGQNPLREPIPEPAFGKSGKPEKFCPEFSVVAEEIPLERLDIQLSRMFGKGQFKIFVRYGGLRTESNPEKDVDSPPRRRGGRWPIFPKRNTKAVVIQKGIRVPERCLPIGALLSLSNTYET